MQIVIVKRKIGGVLIVVVLLGGIDTTIVSKKLNGHLIFLCQNIELYGC